MKVPYVTAALPDNISKGYRRILEARRDNLLASLERVPGAREPYDLEIGCGHGHFMAGYAAAHPERYGIGIDISGGRLERAQRKTDRSGLNNVSWIQAEAELFLESVPETIRFSRVFILFPDPWPKKRHHKHRLVSSGFLNALATVCTAGATLYFRSDHFPYVDAVQNVIAASSEWEPSADAPWAWEEPSVFQELADQYRSLVAIRA